MTSPVPKRWSLRFGFWVLLVIPVVCALIFWAIRELGSISTEDRWKLESQWVTHPLKTEFLPAEGARFRRGDPLLKVARIYPKGTADSWLIMPNGMIGHMWHYGFDAGGDTNLNPASTKGLSALRDYLKKLPPSNITTATTNSLVIAYPSDWVWVVRRYRLDAIPKEANDIAAGLDFHSSFNGKAVKAW
jgi:hypothetical protein